MSREFRNVLIGPGAGVCLAHRAVLAAASATAVTPARQQQLRDTEEDRQRPQAGTGVQGKGAFRRFKGQAGPGYWSRNRNWARSRVIDHGWFMA